MQRFLLVGICGLIAAATAFAGQAATEDAAGREALPVRAQTSPILPGTRVTAFTVIRGNALDSAHAALPNSVVRLRDARYGRVVNTQTTDTAGLFEFRMVDPGSYVIELLGADRTVLAASQLFHVNAGEVVSAVVTLPLRLSPFRALIGHTAQQAAAIVSAAAASGVLATRVVGVDASPNTP